MALVGLGKQKLAAHVIRLAIQTTARGAEQPVKRLDEDLLPSKFDLKPVRAREAGQAGQQDPRLELPWWHYNWVAD